ncbi:MAG TPA: sarcosine oxidase subunit alpha family protein [Steroidobacteraceae bacterium]|nr:sarcosine oxidase subunit alpha family protein [Steroidobacteraceae bacterium]
MSEAAQPKRISRGGMIDRARALSFRFDDRDYTGYAGDTLASALLANGIRRVGRSFKYHRSRGVLTAGPEEPNALVELRTGDRREPNTRATVTELFAGLEARSQNRWPSLALDLGAVSSCFSPLFVAGFYYKTFMWPKSFWEKLYEPAIRRAAGLGRASGQPDPDGYEKSFGFCDVLVIGAGPAGLAAALAAARRGARVVLCEEDFLLGGRLNAERCSIDGSDAVDWVRRVEAELASFADVRILRRTSVFGLYDGTAGSHSASGTRTFGAVERVSDHLQQPPQFQPRQRLWKIVARRAVLAAGAVERTIAFGGNDRPGIMLASAVRSYVNRFAVLPGRRVAVFTSTDDGWKAAFDLSEAGASVEALIDARGEPPASLIEQLRATGARLYAGSRVVEGHGSAGLSGVTIMDSQARRTRLRVDALAVSGGWNPNLALATHTGSKPRWSERIHAFVPDVLPGGLAVAGAARGALTLREALSEGAEAGAAAAEQLGFSGAAGEQWRADEEASEVAPLWFVGESRGKAFVDFQHDVTHEDVALAAREGFRSVEHLKRYTTLGMATDQGRTSALNAHAIMSALTGRSIAELGTPGARPPCTPVAIGAFAGPHRGRHFRPTRRTAGHGWAQEQGATFIEAGDWLRAQWFAQPGESDWQATVDREVKAVRTRVGLCDVSTLGKVDIQGRDAAKFLDRVYSNVFSTLPVGKVRYGLMLREDGFVLDDGTSAHLSPDHYVMSTTTANAQRVLQHLEHARQLLWPDLDVRLASVTEQWAQYAIAGPESRRLLEQALGDALSVSNQAFPYLACAEFRWQGVPARLFRISFSGELAYELAVPAQYGDAAVRAIAAAGASLGVVPYGLESLNVMRIEKGHLTGNELNGTTTAADLGMGRLMSTRKDFIGRVLAQRPGLTDPRRPALVGVRPIDPYSPVRSGAHFLSMGEPPTLENDQGYVTSAAFSPMLNSWIALGLLSRGRERLGERIRIHDPVRSGTDVEVEVVAPVFFDPAGERLVT